MNKLKSNRWKQHYSNINYHYELIELAEPYAPKYPHYPGHTVTHHRIKYYDGIEHSWYYGISGHRPIRSYQAKKMWYKYIYDLEECGLVNHSMRRSANSIPDAYDDYSNDMYHYHKKSWKKHTKCRKQWEKNLK